MSEEVVRVSPRQKWLAAITLFICGIVLFALLLPPVHLSNRTRRSQCESFLSALSSATMQCETAHRRYPGMMEAFGQTSSGSVKVATWHVRLLPYLEQEPLYEAWADPETTPKWHPGNSDFYPDIRLFGCDPKPSSWSKPLKARYVANAGLASMDPALPQLPNYTGDASQDSALAQRSDNAIFSNQLPAVIITPMAFGQVNVFGSGAKPCSSSDVKDGLTMTVAFSENIQAGNWNSVSLTDDSTRVEQGMLWRYALSSGTAASGRPAALTTITTNHINGNATTAKVGDFNAARPSSSHPGIVNVAFLGGSVSAISNRIDYRVYQSLLTPYSKRSDMPDNVTVLRDQDFVE